MISQKQRQLLQDIADGKQPTRLPGWGLDLDELHRQHLVAFWPDRARGPGGPGVMRLAVTPHGEEELGREPGDLTRLMRCRSQLEHFVEVCNARGPAGVPDAFIVVYSLAIGALGVEPTPDWALAYQNPPPNPVF